jgi:hypothetical protein
MIRQLVRFSRGTALDVEGPQGGARGRTQGCETGLRGLVALSAVVGVMMVGSAERMAAASPSSKPGAATRCPHPIPRKQFVLGEDGRSRWKPTERDLQCILAWHRGWLARQPLAGELPLCSLSDRDAYLDRAFRVWRSEAQRHYDRADLNNADLRYAQLNGAHLRGAQLNGADLNRAQLQRADLTQVNIANAKLAHTDLTGAAYAPDSDPPILTMSPSKVSDEQYQP